MKCIGLINGFPDWTEKVFEYLHINKREWQKPKSATQIFILICWKISFLIPKNTLYLSFYHLLLTLIKTSIIICTKINFLSFYIFIIVPFNLLTFLDSILKIYTRLYTCCIFTYLYTFSLVNANIWCTCSRFR